MALPRVFSPKLCHFFVSNANVTACAVNRMALKWFKGDNCLRTSTEQLVTTFDPLGETGYTEGLTIALPPIYFCTP